MTKERREYIIYIEGAYISVRIDAEMTKQNAATKEKTADVLGFFMRRHSVMLLMPNVLPMATVYHALSLSPPGVCCTSFLSFTF